MKSTYLFILLLALVGSFLSVGCMFKDGDSKTLKEEKAKELERVRKQNERDRVAGMSVAEIKKELQKEMLTEKQKRKIESDKGTRKSLLSVQKWAALLLIGGLALAYLLPAGKKKWGLGICGAAVTSIILCATLSYYLDAFRLVTAILLGLLVIAVLSGGSFGHRGTVAPDAALLVALHLPGRVVQCSGQGRQLLLATDEI